MTSEVTSSPRWAGRQCMKRASDRRRHLRSPGRAEDTTSGCGLASSPIDAHTSV